MSIENKLEQVYEDGASRAELNKDSGEPMASVAAFVAAQDADGRARVEQEIARWAERGDALRRFTALAVIDRLSLRSAIPTLRHLANRFESAEGPSAPYDWAKVNRILGRLIRQR